MFTGRGNSWNQGSKAKKKCPQCLKARRGEGTTAVIQMRNMGCSELAGSRGGGEKWFDSG